MANRIIELGHDADSKGQPLISVPAMVLESVGPKPHEARVPFHDSQAKRHALLIQTGWDSKWGTEEYWGPAPHVSDDVVFRAVRSGARLIGVDFSVSRIRTDQTRIITDGKIPIIENLARLTELPRYGFQIKVIPLEDPTKSGYSVRVFAELTSAP